MKGQEMLYGQKWQVWVNGVLVRITQGPTGAQAMLKKTKQTWHNGFKIEVVAII